MPMLLRGEYRSESLSQLQFISFFFFLFTSESAASLPASYSSRAAPFIVVVGVIAWVIDEVGIGPAPVREDTGPGEEVGLGFAAFEEFTHMSIKQIKYSRLAHPSQASYN